MEKDLFSIDPTNQKSINQLLLEGKFEEAQELLKKTMASEKKEKSKDTIEVL
jgi:ribosomal protein S7